jgi:hypothetical protein
MSNNPENKREKENKNNEKDNDNNDNFIKMTSTGIVDFEIIISLTEIEANQFQIHPEKIETIKDLKKLFFPNDLQVEENDLHSDSHSLSQCQKKTTTANIYDYIKLTSNNKTINSLLFINRAFKKKAFIEYVTMSEIKFKEGEEFLKEIVKNITEQNFLFLVENEFLPNLNSKISIIFKIENKVIKNFNNICLYVENKNTIEKETNTNIIDNENEKGNDDGIENLKNDNNQNQEINKDNNSNNNEENNSNNTNKELNTNLDKKSLRSSSKDQREENTINELNNNNNKNEENLNLNEEEKNTEDNIDNEDEENKDNQREMEMEDDEENLNKLNEEKEIRKNQTIFERFKYDFTGTDYFFVDINEIFELKLYGFTIPDFYELIKKIADDFKKISIIINFPNIIKNIGYLDLESINILNEIITLTDTFIFDKKDALALFNLIAQINSEEDDYEDKKNLEHLFIKEIKKKRKNHPKIGIFLDDLKQVTIIEQNSSNLILFHTDYDFDLIPANVSKNVNSDYKKLFVVHYEYLKSVFIGGLFSRILYQKPFNNGFQAGNESLKRVVELLRFELDFPADPNFFLIKIKKNNKEKLTEKEEQVKLKKKMEQRFLVDSTNLLSSKMDVYNPLYDNNLISYFSSKFIRKHLINLGFINRKGNILEDPDNKKLGIIESKKLNRAYEEEKENLQKIKDRKEKMTIQIKNLLQGNHIIRNGNIKEIEKLAKVYNFNPKADKKLPSVNDYKKSINKNIKINSQIYLKEVKKGKQKIHSKNNNNNKNNISNNNNNYNIKSTSSNNNTKLEGKNLLDVIDKIQDKILYDTSDNFNKIIINNNEINNENIEENINNDNENNNNNNNEENNSKKDAQKNENNINNNEDNNINNKSNNYIQENTEKKSVRVDTEKKSVRVDTEKKSSRVDTEKKSVRVDTEKKSSRIDTEKKSSRVDTEKKSPRIDTGKSKILSSKSIRSKVFSSKSNVSKKENSIKKTVSDKPENNNNDNSRVESLVNNLNINLQDEFSPKENNSIIDNDNENNDKNNKDDNEIAKKLNLELNESKIEKNNNNDNNNDKDVIESIGNLSKISKKNEQVNDNDNYDDNNSYNNNAKIVNDNANLNINVNANLENVNTNSNEINSNNKDVKYEKKNNNENNEFNYVIVKPDDEVVKGD